MKLFHDHFAPALLRVEGETAGLSVDAAKSADGRSVVVKLVNPSDAAREVSLELNGFVSGKTSFQLVAPDNLNARNTLEHPDLVHPVAAKVASNQRSCHDRDAALVRGRFGDRVRGAGRTDEGS